MNLLVLWSSFILIISYSEEFTLYQYVFSTISMFGLTYFCNRITVINLSLKMALSFLNIPGLIMWYIIFVYNDFLAINPISSEFFIGLFIIYNYLVLYFILSEE